MSELSKQASITFVENILHSGKTTALLKQKEKYMKRQ